MPKKSKHHRRVMSQMPSAPTRSRGFVSLLLVVLGGILLWGVVARSLVAAFVVSNPDVAKILAPSMPDLLIDRADRSLKAIQVKVESKKSQQSASPSINTAEPSGNAPTTAEGASAPPAPTTDVAEIREWVSAALRREPLASHGLTVLGLLAEADGQHELADRYMKAAAERSHREVSAVYWTFRRSFETNKFDDAAAFVDALLRKKPAMITVAAPILGRMSENPGSVDLVSQVLARDPPWRKQFFGSLKGNITDARTPLKLLLNLNDTASPPTKDELKAYLAFLFSHDLHELAYSSWLQFLTSERLARAAFVNNGSFEMAISEMPFDWNIPRQTGALVGIASRDDQVGQHALSAEFTGGRVEFQPVWQTIMLPPGQYTVSGLSKGDLKGRRGLVWQLHCLGKSTVLLGESAMSLGNVTNWVPFEFSVTVPEATCRAQRLSLSLASRSASETMVLGQFWFDDLKISRTGNVTPVQ